LRQEETEARQAERERHTRLLHEMEEAKEGIESRTRRQQQAEEEKRRREKEEEEEERQAQLSRQQEEEEERQTQRSRQQKEAEQRALHRREGRGEGKPGGNPCLGFVLWVLLGLLAWWFNPRAPGPPRSLAAEAKIGTLSALKEKPASWATHWSTMEGRTTLRMASIEAARGGQLDVLNYLCKKGKVPINNIPVDEKVEAWATPLVTAVMADREDVALHLLSLAEIDENQTLARKLDKGNTLLHHAARKGQTRLVKKLLRRGASALLVADDGHKPLSLAIDKSDLAVAQVIFDDCRARGLLYLAFEHSFYESRERRVPLLHSACAQRAEGDKTEEEMLAVVTFLVEQGADVAVRNIQGQTPVDVISLCRSSLMHFLLSRCRAPSVHQYLQEQVGKRRGEIQECQTDQVSVESIAEASRRCALLIWPWLRYALWCFRGCFLYCFWGICLGVPFITLVAAEKSPFVAAEEVARQQEERSAKMKKKQKGKNGKKQKGKSERSEPPMATLPPVEEDEDNF